MFSMLQSCACSRSSAARRAAVVAATLVAIACLGLTAPSRASAATAACGYGTGGYQANTLCWLDMSGYSFSQSSASGGQAMTVPLAGGYTASFTVTTTPVSGRTFSPVNAVAFPTWPGAYIGTHAYLSTPGKPALYQTQNSGSDTVTVSNLAVTDSAGQPISGYGLVVADAESTDRSESLTFSSDVPLDEISTSTTQYPYCGNGLTGVGTTSVTCVGGQSGVSDGALVLQANTPTRLSATMNGGGLQAEAFAIVTSKLTVDKQIVGRVKSTDSFDVTATSPEGTAIGTASTGSGNSASTGALTVLPRSAGLAYTLAEAPTAGSGTLASDYSQSWSCANAATDSTTPLPSGSGSSVQVSPAPGDDITCTVTNTQLPADLSIAKTVAPTSLTTGQTATYTYRVVNNGPSSATNLNVTDTLPAGETFVSAGSGCSYAATTRTVSCPLATLAAGATQTYSVLVKVAGAGGTQISNTAQVTSATPDSDTANNQSSASVTITPSADLSIVKTASPTPGVPGTNETYTLRVSNAGPDRAANVKVSDPLPVGLTFVSADTGCTQQAGVVTCSLDGLRAGESHTFTVVARLDADRTAGVVNTATVTSDTDDPDPNDNSSTTSAPLGPKADLSIVKTASTDTVQAGGQATYTLTVVNHGPSAATGVTVIDQPPAVLSVVAVHAGQGSCTARAGVVCQIGTLPPGGSTQVLVTVSVAPTASGKVANVGTVIGQQPDPDKGDNSSTSSVTVPPSTTPPPVPPSSTSQPVAGLSVVKRVNARRAQVGQALTYTIRVTNHGPDAAAGVTVTDTPRIALTHVSIHPSRGKCATGLPIHCRLGRLASGAHVRIVVHGRPRRSGDERNVVSATSAARDPKLGDNLARATTRLRAPRSPAPRLQLRKTATPRSVVAGHDVRFRITVRDPGTVAIGHVTVCDRLPAELLFVRATPHAKLAAGGECWTIGRLAAHATKRFVLIANAASSAHGGRVVNHATVRAPGVRRVSATAAVRLQPAPHVGCGSVEGPGDASAPLLPDC